jgi:eukaryotic-like serine/threonine-protein kinase
MLILGAGGVAIAVLVGVLVSTLGSGGNDSPSGGGSPGSGHFTAESPWRLVIRDNIEGNDIGCDVTVKNTDAGQQEELTDIYGTLVIQVHETGSFSWEANDPGCLVVHRPGSGKAVLPFAQDGGGDTDAFETRGKVAVEVKDFHGNSGCDLELYDATDGRQLDFGTVPKGRSRLLLDPSGRDQVYLRNWYCGIRVSSA